MAHAPGTLAATSRSEMSWLGDTRPKEHSGSVRRLQGTPPCLSHCHVSRQLETRAIHSHIYIYIYVTIQYILKHIQIVLHNSRYIILYSIDFNWLLFQMTVTEAARSQKTLFCCHRPDFGTQQVDECKTPLDITASSHFKPTYGLLCSHRGCVHAARAILSYHKIKLYV